MNNDHLLPDRWQRYVGIMVESTASKNQRWFHIFVPEFMPQKIGNVSNETVKQNVDIKNVITNQQEKSSVEVSCTIYADYWGLTSGYDVPTMNRGMQVIVFNYGNTDKWYWIPLERDDSLKTFEHHRISCADISKTNKTSAEADDIEGKDKGLTDDNTYYMEIDTKYRKHIKISTSASDGEAWRYFIEIDAEAHSIELWDNCVDGSQPNNTIKIESKPDPETKGRITIQNASNNSIIMNGLDTTVNIPRNLMINIGGDTLVNNTGNVTTHILSNFTSIVDMNESCTVGGMTNHIYVNNYTEAFKENRFSSTIKASEENYLTKKIMGTSTSISTIHLGIFSALTTVTGGMLQVTMQTINTTVSEAWTLITKYWTEISKTVAGTVVALIRGGHH